jgi:hypothetical protein
VIDITDPANPKVVHSHQVTGSVNFDYRGVSVDQNNMVLGITEEISFIGGSRMGYVRFYDLSKNPAEPQVIGQEKLAEDFSGFPGSIDILNGYAYIATVGIGLQVIDIARASEIRAITDGTSIVGGLDPISRGYGHPNDIRIYKNNRAIMTTNSGYLLTININTPSNPTMITAYKPDDLSISRVGVAADFFFSSKDGAISELDLAIMGTYVGKICTLDLTDPANPQIIGTVKDVKGDEVTSWIRDVVFNKGEGLAIATSLSSILIIDINDPENPILLHTIIGLPDENGKMQSIGFMSAIVERNGWVFMANRATGMLSLEYGSVSVNPSSKYMVLDGDNKPKINKLGYTISPLDYVAYSAEVIIYKDGQQMDSVETSVQQQGEIDLSQYTFEADSTYYAQVVLNRKHGVRVESQKIPFIHQAVLIPDYNRDRIINMDDRVRAMKGDTFYFWINDDDDRPGEEVRGDATDIPGSTYRWYANGEIFFPDKIHNYENNVVDGVRDLIDLFPLQLNLKDLLAVFPSDQYEYRLTTGGEHLNFAYANLSADKVGQYLTGDLVGDLSDVREHSYVITTPISNDGVQIFESALGEIFHARLSKEGRDILLFEGREFLQGPLKLEVSKGNSTLFSFELDLNINGVENMFRHLNLIQAIDNITAPVDENAGISESKSDGGEIDRLSASIHYPDNEADGLENPNPRYVVWLHGAKEVAPFV